VAEKNVIFLTVNLPDINESTLQYALTSTSLSFKADTTSGTHYAFDLELYAEVDTEKSTQRLNSRSLVVLLRKKESKSEYWPRLTKEKIRTAFVKTDFSKWVDEDEQDGNPTSIDESDFAGGGFPGMSDDMDLSKLMQQSGANVGDFPPGGGDVIDSDSDEDGPPPLEEPVASK